jgi:murein DD-endopeptidase MepM/ murein hydrolase activator NlpD
MPRAVKTGDNFQPRQQRSKRIAVLLVGGVLSGALFTIALAALFFVRSRGIERTAPTIAIEDKGRILSAKGIVIPLVVKDDGSGIERVVAWVQQSGKVKEVFRATLPQQDKFVQQIEISPTALGLSQGEMMLIVEATDASMWRNKASRIVPLSVDNDPPRIEVIARSESIAVAELGVAAYRVDDASLQSTGVSLGVAGSREVMFEGRLAKEVDPALVVPGVYVSFFVASQSCPSSSSIFAADEGGNLARTPFSLQCQGAARGVSLQQSVATDEILARAEQLIGGGNPWDEALKREIAKAKAEGSARARTAIAAIARFLLTTARESDLEDVAKAARGSLASLRWWRSAARVGVFSQRAGFHDTIALADAQGALASVKTNGVEMVPMQPGFSVVFSPYRGTVRLSRKLGVLGDVVVIDHGAGLSSVFYSLEGRYVENGASVEEGQQVGRIGDSGFHFSKALRMQFLLSGEAIDPGALLDLQRFYQNVELPLNGVRLKTGVSSQPSAVRRPG